MELTKSVNTEQSILKRAYEKLKNNNKNNNFWTSVSKAVFLFHSMYRKVHTTDFSKNAPLCFNSHLNMPFIKWDMKGLRKVGDLLKEPVRIIKTKGKIKEEYGVVMNFIDYVGMIRAIPQEYLTLPTYDHEERIVPWCQQFVLYILTDN